MVLPEHLKSQAEGHVAHVVIESPEPTLASTEHPWGDIIAKFKRSSAPGFAPLSREEANED